MRNSTIAVRWYSLYQRCGFISRLHLLSFFSKIGGIKMKRLIDWFRKPAIMHKLFHTGGEWDGDLVTYKHHKYYVNAQTGTVIRIE